MKTLLLSLLIFPYIIKSQVITTYAGKGTMAWSGDGGHATNAELIKPVGINFDNDGNLIICHEGVIRKVDFISNVISTIAGDGIALAIGDDGPASSALINQPRSICFDELGNMYVADYWAVTVRKINTITNIISRYGGVTRNPGYSGDGGPATAAKIAGAFAICIDTVSDILYLTDTYNYRIRKINMLTGIISTFAGTGMNGYEGEDLLATGTKIGRPIGICLDSNRNVYFGDWDNARVRRIDISTGLITTFVGSGISGFDGDGGSATSAKISQPSGMCFDACGNFFFSDCGLGGGNYRIRKVEKSTGIITTIAGNGITGYFGDGGAATDAQLSRTNEICLDKNGSLYVADIDNNKIRKISPAIAPCNKAYVIENSNINIVRRLIFPNPANDELHIENAAANTTYALSNVWGAVGETGRLKKGSNVIAVRQLPPGLYMLLLTDEEGKRTVHKVVKE